LRRGSELKRETRSWLRRMLWPRDSSRRPFAKSCSHPWFSGNVGRLALAVASAASSLSSDSEPGAGDDTLSADGAVPTVAVGSSVAPSAVFDAPDIL
jgi:hypothetical protein